MTRLWMSGSLAAVCLFGILGGTSLTAQTYNGEPVVELDIEGTTTLSEQTLRFYLGLEEGNAQTTAGLNEKIHLLWSRDLVDDIQVSTEDVDGGVRMVINLHTCASVHRSAILSRIASSLAGA